VGLGISASACGRCHGCACVFVCICMHIRICVGIYKCTFFSSECCMHFTGVLGTRAWAGVFVTGVFLHQRTHLRTHSLQVVHICVCVYMCVYVCICIWMRMCACMILLDTLRRCCSDFLSVHTCAYACVCICVCMYVCIVHVYIYVYVHMYVCVYVCIYIYIHARVGVHMHSCRRILLICTVQSLYYMRVFHRCFFTLACMCVGGLEVEFVSACSWLALVPGVGGYVLAGVEIGVLSCLFF